MLLKVGQTSHLILLLSLQFPTLILNPVEVLLHWLVALACQQLDKTEVRKWTFRGQEAKQPEEPICQLKSSWEWKELFHNVGNTTLPPAWVFPPPFFFQFVLPFSEQASYTGWQKCSVLTVLMESCLVIMRPLSVLILMFIMNIVSGFHSLA